MRNLLLFSALLALTSVGRGGQPGFSTQKEIETYFDGSPVRLAIYIEYIVSTDFKELALQNTWATLKNDADKEPQNDNLITLLRGLNETEAQWSDGIRHVLEVSTLTRSEADQIIKYMLDRRAGATQMKKAVTAALSGASSKKK